MREPCTICIDREDLDKLQELRDELGYLCRRTPSAYPWYTVGQRVTLAAAVKHLLAAHFKKEATDYPLPVPPGAESARRVAVKKSSGKSRSKDARESA